jgi:heterotetrameric sarcosine oxidase gamma subunit
MAELGWSDGLERAGVSCPGGTILEAANLHVRVAVAAQTVIACHSDPALGAPPPALLDALAAVLGHALPLVPNTRVGIDQDDSGDYAVWLDPSRWLTVGLRSRRRALLQALQNAVAHIAPDALISDASDALVILDITGASAPALMTMACALDIDLSVFAPPRTARAPFAGAGSALLYRRGEGFRAHVDATLIEHVRTWLEQAARLLPLHPRDSSSA